MDPTTTTTHVTIALPEGTAMGAFVARPKRAARGGMLVFQEAFGVNAHIRDIAQRWATEGYTAIAPELFHRTAPGFEGKYDDFQAVMPHIQKLTPEGIAADIRAAHHWLETEGEIGGAAQQRIGAIGFCMGGRVALRAAASVPLAGAVSYYGAGFPPADAGKVAAPMLMFWGGLDKHITAEIRRALVDALTMAGKDFSSTVFAQADHGFNCDQRPSFQPEAAALAGGMASAFFERHIR
ncbi:MAG: dienelactone hydrolase family protein [Terriglobales bacterium]